MDSGSPDSFAAYEPPARHVARRRRARQALRRARLVVFGAMLLVVAGSTITLAVTSQDAPRRAARAELDRVGRGAESPVSSPTAAASRARTSTRRSAAATPATRARSVQRTQSAASAPTLRPSVQRRARDVTEPLPFTGPAADALVLVVTLAAALAVIVGMLVQIAVQPLPHRRS